SGYINRRAHAIIISLGKRKSLASINPEQLNKQVEDEKSIEKDFTPNRTCRRLATSKFSRSMWINVRVSPQLSLERGPEN
ncbi:hypothetical protein ACTXT7_017273, partial [Hymenolepis weldensis]